MFFRWLRAQGYDLTIAGHTHGGQVDVEILHQHVNVARYFTPYVRGLYRHQKSSVYVSNGLGTIGVPVRLGAPPGDFGSSPVRYLILSDIHANWEALSAVLARRRIALRSRGLLRRSGGLWRRSGRGCAMGARERQPASSAEITTKLAPAWKIWSGSTRWRVCRRYGPKP